ncbi:MAG: hypothetical protein A2X36_03635 [Elusimicrobia bacterium GWA2_69_24]|nr:MAG: hypothetical protein A2X36_03635 [Elusimicrobia bacterium GWA2_69_24]HBL15614.1 saccharopine dehydrogenase [Elusimicrobiota bacterium]
MKTIVILGGYGRAGRALVPLLIQETDAKLVLLGRDPVQAIQAAKDWNARFPGERVSGVSADASDEASIKAALQDAALVVVVSNTAEHTFLVASIALSFGLDYIDIQYSSRKLEILRSLKPELERAKVCFVTEAGLHPGLPSALVRHAAQEFEVLEKARVALVCNPEGGLPRTGGADELMDSFREYEPLVWEGGVWRKLGFFGCCRPIELGEGFGRRSCAALGSSEMTDLPRLVPTLKETGLWVAGFNAFTDWVLAPLAMLLGRRMGGLFCWSTRAFQKRPYGNLLQLDAEGQDGGKKKTLRVTLSHADAYAFTAAALAACILQLLDRGARQPGLHFMGHLVQPARLLRDMERMGVKVVKQAS